MTPDIDTASDESLESWFLASVSEPDLPLSQLSTVLEKLHSEGRTEQAETLADLVQEALNEKDMIQEGLSLLQLRASWHEDEKSFAAVCKGIALRLLRKHRSGASFVSCCGLDSGLSATKGLLRLQNLLALTPDSPCCDKTWGFGFVRRVDEFYERITVDFDRKKAHELSFSHAAESLEPVADDHILMQKHRCPERLAELARSNPSQIIKTAIRSYGPLNVVQLQEALVPHVIQESEWKTFWAAARSALKSDPMVALPPGRNDPIRLAAPKKTSEAARYGELTLQNKPADILAQVEDMVANQEVSHVGSHLEAVAEKLRLAADAAADSRLDLVARAVLAADCLGVQHDNFDKAKYVRLVFEPDAFLAACTALQTKKLREFFRYLGQEHPDEFDALLLGTLPQMGTTLLAEAASILSTPEKKAGFDAVLCTAVRKRNATIETLLWIARHLDTSIPNIIAGTYELAEQVICCMERPMHGEQLKAAKQFRTLFDRAKWIKLVLDGMSDEQKQAFALRLRYSAAFPRAERTSLIMKMAKIEPVIEKAFASGESQPGESVATNPRVTSWRSYNQKLHDLQHLESVDIPQNSRDIAHARSYGDLSENYEYKAAKEAQSILFAKRNTLVQQLKEVKGTVFADFPSSRVGIGTRVLLGLTEEDRREYFILGEWDNEQEMSIISCLTTLAKVLKNAKPGDIVEIPDSTGNTRCRVLEVGPLPERISSWAAGTQTPG